jgi:hypothetical protein
MSIRSLSHVACQGGDLPLVEQMDTTVHLPGETVLGYHCVAPT